MCKRVDGKILHVKVLTKFDLPAAGIDPNPALLGRNPKQNKSELEKIPYDEFNIANPVHYAALLRERGHTKYNASTSNRVRKSLLENL